MIMKLAVFLTNIARLDCVCMLISDLSIDRLCSFFSSARNKTVCLDHHRSKKIKNSLPAWGARFVSSASNTRTHVSCREYSSFQWS